MVADGFKVILGLRFPFFTLGILWLNWLQFICFPLFSRVMWLEYDGCFCYYALFSDCNRFSRSPKGKGIYNGTRIAV